jgi:hypothetical protein
LCPQLGVSKKLFQLDLELCPIEGPVRDLMNNSRYPTKDILGFLHSIYEE